MRKTIHIAMLCLLAASLVSCEKKSGPVVGVAFDTLQTEYWVASINALKSGIAKQGAQMQQVVADNDADRQLAQVKNLIAQKVDGIIVAPKDARAVIPMIKAANKASIPIVLYNRPPAEEVGTSVTVVADNRKITKATVGYMCEQARKSGRKYKALVLIGDLADINAKERRDGFDEAVSEHKDIINVVSRVNSNWKLEDARSGVASALQENPDINFIFSSSDFLLPAVVAVLQEKGKHKKIGEEGHVLMGGFDGDAYAYQMLVDGYLDADGVQDVQFECDQAVKAVFDLKAGKKVDAIISDPGFVIHQGNLAEMKSRMWGANVKK